MAKHFKNLKNLKLNNTDELEKLKANELIESVTLENSKILSLNSFKKKVPEPLLSRNNMANYTQAKLNGVLLSENEIAKMKLGKMNVEHNDRIEVIDGVLAGTIFTIILGTPLNELIKDQTLLTHVKELLNKETSSSLVSLYELQTITWLGKNPSEVTELNYLGYFNTKTIGNIETFQNDLKQFPNLQYINLAGAFFTNDLDLNDFNLTNFKYSFANCSVLQNVVINKRITDLEGTFRNCQNLRTVTIGENAELSNMNKTFYGCKGILNFAINNPNMTDTDNPNVFEESLISTLTFTKEPVENTITSNLLKYAIYSSSTLNLDNKNRPDLYNLTSTANAKLEKLTLNSTNIQEIDLTKPISNFTNLKYLEANNTSKLQSFKLNGSNLTNISFANSSVLYQKINDDETPRIFIENKDYYSRVSINSVELTEAEILELKNGTRKFNHADTIEFLNGPLLNISFKITTGITSDVISNVFPDPTLAEYIRMKTNKTTINDIITQGDLDTIIYFGYDGLQRTGSEISWFDNKEVNSWTGTEYLKKIKNIYLKGVLGTANQIEITSKEIQNICYAFYNCSNLKTVIFPKRLPNISESASSNGYFKAFYNCNLNELYTPLPINGFGSTGSNESFLQQCDVKKIIIRELDEGDTDPIILKYLGFNSNFTSTVLECQGTSSQNITDLSFVFINCRNLTSVSLPISMPGLTSLNNAFANCSSLTSINLPNELSNLNNLGNAFHSCTNLTSIILPAELPNLTSLSSTFNGCSKLTSITLPAKLPNVTTMLTDTYLDSTGRTIIYHPDDTVTNLYQITYHNYETGYPEYLQSTLDYSNLGNLVIDYPPGQIKQLFPDPTLAEYIRMKLNKATISEKITQADLDTITYFGFDSDYQTTTSVSWFNGKTVNSWKGVEHLRKIRNILVKGVGGTADKITIKSSEIVNLIHAFTSCSSLTTIEFLEPMNNLTELTQCFSFCSALTSVVLPTSLPKLTRMYGTFSNCSSLVSLTLPNELPVLNNMNSICMSCIKLTSVTIASELPLLENFGSAFNGCSMLENITPIAQMEKAYEFTSAFRGCSSLKTFTFPTNLPKLKYLTNAFYNCTSLTFLQLPETAPVLEDAGYLAYNCRNIQTIVLPNELPVLSSLHYTFYDCDGLRYVHLPPTIPKLTTTLANTCLEGSSRTYIYHPNPEVDDVQKITLHPTTGTKDYSNLINLLMFGQAFSDSVLSQYICNKLGLNESLPMDSSKLASLKELTDFPNGINNFEGLKYCKNLEYVSFKNNVNYRVINLKHCFDLKRLNNSFSGCINLENLELPDNLEGVTDYENIIFDCPKLLRICVPNIKNKESLNLILKEFDLEGKILELKGNLNKFSDFNIIKHIIKANIAFCNEVYNKPLNFYFGSNLKEVIKAKLNLTEENPNITKVQLDSITDLILNTKLEGNLELAILTNLTSLIVNDSLTFLNLKYAKNITNITFNNCELLKELFLPINNNCVKNINLTINGVNTLREIYANKGINLDYPGFKKNL